MVVMWDGQWPKSDLVSKNARFLHLPISLISHEHNHECTPFNKTDFMVLERMIEDHLCSYDATNIMKLISLRKLNPNQSYLSRLWDVARIIGPYTRYHVPVQILKSGIEEAYLNMGKKYGP